MRKRKRKREEVVEGGKMAKKGKRMVKKEVEDD